MESSFVPGFGLYLYKLSYLESYGSDCQRHKLLLEIVLASGFSNHLLLTTCITIYSEFRGWRTVPVELLRGTVG